MHDVTHSPEEHFSPPTQDPHDPPQPSVPQSLPVQAGVQVFVTQLPAVQVWLLVQDPHDPPQPSAPQSVPAHFGVQVPATHDPEVQVSPVLHEPHEPPQPSAPQSLPVQFGEHVAEQDCGWSPDGSDPLWPQS